MNRSGLRIILVNWYAMVALCGMAMAHEDHSEDEHHETDIRAVLHAFHKAHSDLDYSAYSKLLAPIFTSTEMNGSADPIEWRAAYSHTPGSEATWTPGAGYENDVSVLRVDVRGDRAHAWTREIGRNPRSQWDAYNLYSLVRIDSKWKVASMTMRIPVDGGLGSLIELGDIRGVLDHFDGLPASQRDTTLHIAAMRGSAAVVEALLARGAPLDAPDDSGYTALHRAMRAKFQRRAGREPVIRHLLDQGAKVDLMVAMGLADPDKAKAAMQPDAWRTIGPEGSPLFDGVSLDGWAPLTPGWRARDRSITSPTSERIQFLLSRAVATGPFELEAEISLLDRARGDGKMIGFVDAAGNSVIGYLDDETPNTILVDSGHRVFDKHGVYGSWFGEVELGLAPLETGPWYPVHARIDGNTFTFSCGEAQIQAPFTPEFPVFIWLEVQRTGARFRNIRVQGITPSDQADAEKKIRVRAFIDGSDSFVFSPDGLSIIHHAHLKPGHWGPDGERQNLPTYVNGEAWVPDWHEEQSDSYSLPWQPARTSYRLTRIEGRGKMTMSSPPSAQEAVVRIEDPDYGAAWYEFELRLE